MEAGVIHINRKNILFIFFLLFLLAAIFLVAYLSATDRYTADNSEQMLKNMNIQKVDDYLYTVTI